MALAAIPARVQTALAAARAGIATLVRRLPFGIGTVVMVLSAALIASAGAVLAMGTPEQAPTFAYGQLRAYPHTPTVAWSISNTTLPGYSSDSPIEVTATHDTRWLVRYPAGTGWAYLLVDRATGHRVWDNPLEVGVGSCGVTDSGTVGCAVRAAGELASGFYLLTGDGTPGQRSELADTTEVIGIGDDFLRISSSSNTATLSTDTGERVWSKTFDSTPSAHLSPNGLVEFTTVAAARFVLDPKTGSTLLECTDCTITDFPDGITVDRTTPEEHVVESYAINDGALSTAPTNRITGMRSLPGPASLAVLSPTGASQMQAVAGRYVILDPATPGALWQISDDELSKANTRPCGSTVAFALKDRSRSFYTLADGTHLGTLPTPALTDPDANLDYLRCVGSAGNLAVFANQSQLTAIDPGRGAIAWTFPIAGQAEVIDGYLALQEGTTLRVLKPGQYN